MQSNTIALAFPNPRGVYQSPAAYAATKPAAAPKPAATPAKPPAKLNATPVPSKSAAVGSREWAACLIQQFGRDAGARYIGAELSYMAALDQAIAERRGAPRVGASQPSAPKQRGFAAKIRINPGAFQVLGKGERRQAAAKAVGK